MNSELDNINIKRILDNIQYIIDNTLADSIFKPKEIFADTIARSVNPYFETLKSGKPFLTIKLIRLK